MRFFFILLLSIFPFASSYAEDFVSTMEAVQDISVGQTKEDYFHTATGPSFIIPKDELFYSSYTCEPSMNFGVNYGCIKDDEVGDYSCVIRYKGKNYDVSTCIWLMDGWMRNPHDSDPFRFVKTRPANSPDLKLDN